MATSDNLKLSPSCQIQRILKKNMPLSLFISGFEKRYFGTSLKSYNKQLPLSSCLVTSVFISAVIIFYNFLEFHSTLSEKIFSSKHLNFLRDLPVASTPVTTPKTVKRDKVFCQCSLSRFENIFFK